MPRINIVGNPGSGKSTFAQNLGKRLGTKVVHLDALFWEPNWKEPESQAFRNRLETALSEDSWICEGNYATRTFDLRLPQSDIFIWMDTPPAICILRLIARSYKRGARPDLPVGCNEGLFINTLELIREVSNFKKSRRPRIEIERRKWGNSVREVRLEDKKDMEKFCMTMTAFLGQSKS